MIGRRTVIASTSFALWVARTIRVAIETRVAGTKAIWRHTCVRSVGHIGKAEPIRRPNTRDTAEAHRTTARVCRRATARAQAIVTLRSTQTGGALEIETARVPDFQESFGHNAERCMKRLKPLTLLFRWTLLVAVTLPIAMRRRPSIVIEQAKHPVSTCGGCARFAFIGERVAPKGVGAIVELETDAFAIIRARTVLIIRAANAMTENLERIRVVVRAQESVFAGRVSEAGFILFAEARWIAYRAIRRANASARCAETLRAVIPIRTRGDSRRKVAGFRTKASPFVHVRNDRA